MSQTFEQRSGAESDYHAEHNGIDFRYRRMQMLGLTNLEQVLELWWQHDDGTEQQLTPNNLYVNLSNVENDPMDRVMAYDESSDYWIVWWRQDYEDFDALAKEAMNFGKTTLTPDPEPDVAKMFIQQHAIDLASLEAAVDGWATGETDGTLGEG